MITHAELKRKVGYVQPEWSETCGTCRRCIRRGNHLRCNRWGFAVQSDGICRNGYERHDAPLNPEEHPLFYPLVPADHYRREVTQ